MPSQRAARVAVCWNYDSDPWRDRLELPPPRPGPGRRSLVRVRSGGPERCFRPFCRAVEVVRYRVMARFRSEKAAGAGRRPAPAGGETGPVRLATAERAWSALRGLRCGGRRRVGVGQALSLRRCRSLPSRIRFRLRPARAECASAAPGRSCRVSARRTGWARARGLQSRLRSPDRECCRRDRRSGR